MSEQLPAPLQVVCRVAGVSRSAACEARRRRGISEPPRRRPGPVGAMTDRELLCEIRDVLARSPFVGEGHRKVWARLRRRGVRTSRKRVLRLTRGAGLLAPTPKVRKRAARLHDGTITVTVPDTLWATDATEGWSEEGRCAVFVMIDHASGEAWADAGLRMDRFAAADLLREVTSERFGPPSEHSPSPTTTSDCSSATATAHRSKHEHTSLCSLRPSGMIRLFTRASGEPGPVSRITGIPQV